jgi:hypothetical protein
MQAAYLLEKALLQRTKLLLTAAFLNLPEQLPC